MLGKNNNLVVKNVGVFDYKMKSIYYTFYDQLKK